MRRKHSRRIGGLALTLGLLPLFATSGLAGEDGLAGGVDRFGERAVDHRLADRSRLLLRGYEFDPLGQPLAPVALGKHSLFRASYPKGRKGYYIVQGRPNAAPDWGKQVLRTGVVGAGYIPNQAYLVKASAAQVEKIQALPDVRWVGVYQPAFKIEEAMLAFCRESLKGGGAKDGESVVKIRVTTFRGEKAEALTAQVKALDESVRVLSATTGPSRAGRILLSTKRSALPRVVAGLAHLAEVEWIDPAPVHQFFNDNSVWIIQSGESALTPLFDNGLTGTGQILGIADSGLDIDACQFRYGPTNPDDPDDLTYPQRVPAGNTGVLEPDHKVVAYYTQPDADDYDDIYSGFHGTHTTGNAVGDNWQDLASLGDPGRNAGDGMAPGAQVVFQDIGNSWGQLTGLSVTTQSQLHQQAYDSGARVHNNSYGASFRNSYDPESREVDDRMYALRDYVVVWAAGNDGPYPSSLGGSGCVAKSTLTVGATCNQPWTGQTTDPNDLTSFSSHGPTTDLRVKPDIVAPGIDDSATEDQQAVFNSSDTVSLIDNNNCMKSVVPGTSFAAPTVAGGCLLARQYFADGYWPTGGRTRDPSSEPIGTGDSFNPTNSLTKAVVINSGRNLTGLYTASNGVGQAAGPLPNYGQGWGRITLDDALYLTGDDRKLIVLNDVPNGFDTIPGDTLGQAQTASMEHRRIDIFRIQGVTGNEDLRVTLCWSDPPASLAAASALVNNLDLVVVYDAALEEDKRYYCGNLAFSNAYSQPLADGAVGDRRNTTENVFIQSPLAGDYLVIVKGTNVPGTGGAIGGIDTDLQGYSLIATGDFGLPLDSNGRWEDSLTMPLPPTGLAAQATGTSVQLTWTDPAEVTDVRIYRNHQYVGSVSAGVQTFVDTVQGGCYEYVATAAVDDGQVVLESAPSNAVRLFAGAYVRYDFEADNGRFTTGGAPSTLWQWGTPIYGPPGAYSGANAWGTSLTGDYPNGASALLYSPKIDLTGLDNAALSFKHWYHLSVDYNPVLQTYFVDGGRVEISVDGGSSFEPVYPQQGYDLSIPLFGDDPGFASRSDSPTPGYVDAFFDLDPFLGHEVIVRWQIATDGQYAAAGWYLDDVMITGHPPVIPNPPSDPVATPDASTVTVGWSDPTTNTNGTPVTDLYQVRVYRNWALIGVADPGAESYADLSPGQGLHVYYLTAVDTEGYESERSGYAYATVGPATAIDFETDDGEFSARGTPGVWEYGAPTSGPGAAHTGTQVWATVLDGDYPHSSSAFLDTPPIDLSGLDVAALVFHHYYDAEKLYDGGNVQISSDGGVNFALLHPRDGYSHQSIAALGNNPGFSGSGGGYEIAVFDLSSYIGSDVILRWHFASDNKTAAAGWYLDDVVIAGSYSPFLATTEPAVGVRGRTNLAVAVTGLHTHFVVGSSVLSFSGTGLSVQATAVETETTLVGYVAIEPDAAIGARDVVVTTGSEVAIGRGLFVVVAPEIVSVSPDEIEQGAQGVNVTITGRHTAFDGGVTVDFGSGITVNSARALDRTHVQANLAIAQDATPGPRDVNVTSGGEVATGPGVFSVIARVPPVITAVSPPAARPGATIRLQGAGLDPGDGSGVLVSLAGLSTAATVISPNQVRFTVPADVSPGIITDLKVHSQGLLSGEATFTALRNGVECTQRFEDETAARLAADTTTLSQRIEVADVNADGRFDLLVANAEEGIRLFVNLGAGTFADETAGWGISVTGAETRDLVAADFNGDGETDLYVVNRSSDDQLLLNDGAGSFVDAGLTDSNPASLDEAAIVGDVDGDADLDILVLTHASPNRVLINSGQGAFAEEGSRLPPTPSSNDANDAAFGDVDGDGDLDLAVACGISGGQRDLLLLNDGHGNFVDASAQLPAPVVASTSLVFTDFNTDGHLDLVVAHRGAKNSLLTNSGTGSFTDRSDLLPDETSDDRAVAAGDLDGDLDPDLLVIGESADSLRMLLFDQGGEGAGDDQFLEVSRLPTNPGEGTDIDLADLDGDGDLDAVVADMVSAKGTGNRVYINYLATIASVEPASGSPDDTVHVVVTGVDTHFAAEASIIPYFETDAGASGINPSAVTVLSATTIEFDIDVLSQAIIGPRDVKVQQGAISGGIPGFVAKGFGLFQVHDDTGDPVLDLTDPVDGTVATSFGAITFFMHDTGEAKGDPTGIDEGGTGILASRDGFGLVQGVDYARDNSVEDQVTLTMLADRDGEYVFQITPVDVTGRTGATSTVTIIDDSMPPTITPVEIVYLSPYLHVAGLTRLYFSKGMGATPANFTLTGTSSDEGAAGLAETTFSPAFGESPPPAAAPEAWAAIYAVEATDPSALIDVTTSDRAGNSATKTYDIVKDIAAPALTTTTIDDGGSPYLHVSGNTLYFGNNMPAPQPFTITGTSHDAGAGLDRVEFSALLGDSPATAHDEDWSAAYDVDENDQSGTIAITAYDNVMNATVSMIQVMRDFLDPTISNVSVTPVVLRQGAVAAIGFKVSESLESDPVVTVGHGGPAASLVSAEFGTYTYQYVATGAETEGVALPVVITATDQVGNQKTDTSRTLTFDFTPPAFIGSDPPSGEMVNSVSPLRLNFSDPGGDVNEPAICASLSVTYQGAPFPAFQCAAGLDQVVVTIAQAASGVYSFWFVPQDIAGNTAAQQYVSIVQNSPPWITPAIDDIDLLEDLPAKVNLSDHERDVEDPPGPALTWSVQEDSDLFAAQVSTDGAGADWLTLTPEPEASGTGSLTLTLTDSGDGEATQIVLVTITAINDKPVADAGGNQVSYPTQLSLDGSGSSDVEGSALTYQWSQVLGPTVLLSDATAPNPWFVARQADVYQFQLLVHDGELYSDPDVTTVTVLNAEPVAEAGPDQVHYVGTTVTLDGSKSVDANGDALTYEWLPVGLWAELSDGTAMQPSFTPIVSGLYRFQLTVDDGAAESAPDRVDVIVHSEEDHIPTADAGDDVEGLVNTIVTLDGTGSVDGPGANDDTAQLRFLWRRVGGPSVTLVDFRGPNPVFTPVIAGIYSFEVIVTDRTGYVGQPAVANVTVGSRHAHVPVAEAGENQRVDVLTPVTLDGSGSIDEDSDVLYYYWEQSPGRQVELMTDPSDPAATFVPIDGGVYAFELRVYDGMNYSLPDTVHVEVDTEANGVPTADAGDDRATVVDRTILLNGTASEDPDDDALSFEWSQRRGPAIVLDTSAEYPETPNDRQPEFVPVLPGTYVFDLVVRDAATWSAPDTVAIRISEQREGDVDGNGSVDILDALLVALHEAGIRALSAEQLGIADVNHDGYVDILDAWRIALMEAEG